ncbi:MAG: siderophore-interacting protein [Microbacteriaceae bacterium]
MVRHPRLMPDNPRMFRARVLDSRRLSSSFQRVTIAGPELDDFDFRGHDHWFRLFLPAAGPDAAGPDAAGPDAAGAELRLPEVAGRSWWKSYLAIPEHSRPHCSNYTVAGFRGARDGASAELDIDVVLHWEHGAMAGRVAIWAASARPGDPVALLDQGLLFDPPDDAGEVILVADESGLPAVRGILRSLGGDVVGRAIVEVPDPGDVEELAAPPGVSVRWLPRAGLGTPPGGAALAALAKAAPPRPDGYAFVVGESALATGGRRLLHRAGLAKGRITFSGFWKDEHVPPAAP